MSSDGARQITLFVFFSIGVAQRITIFDNGINRFFSEINYIKVLAYTSDGTMGEKENKLKLPSKT